MQAIATPGRYVLADQIVPGNRRAAAPAGVRLPRRRLRLHHGRNPQAGERRNRDRVCARHQARPHGSAFADHAGPSGARPGQNRIERREHRSPKLAGRSSSCSLPLELEPFLAGSNDMQIVLDEGTAGIPWELLDDGGEDEHAEPDWWPWAIRTKLIRKLRTERFRERVVDADAESHALVIGEPECPPGYRRLYRSSRGGADGLDLPRRRQRVGRAQRHETHQRG